jgi:hypothetical protein
VKNRLALIASAAVVALVLPLAACSSSSSSGGSNNGADVSTGAQVNAAGCPFTGTIQTTTGGKSSVAAPVLNAVTTAKEGCVDNVQLKFSGGVGSWTAAYATGPVLDSTGKAVATSGAASLVITIPGATWTGGGTTPATVLPVSLDYVQSINVVNGPNNALLVVFGITAQKPYDASDSQDPAYISLGIG